LQEIAQTKLPDLNANDIEAAMKIVAGTKKYGCGDRRLVIGNGQRIKITTLFGRSKAS